VLEIFFQLMLEKKILLVSKHKSLLTQAAISFQSFIFPLCWKHNLIPILPAEMVDILDAPVPFLFGIESAILNEAQVDFEMLRQEVSQVFLDENQISTPEKVLETVKMPQKELRILREKLLRATSTIKQRPDPEL
jgi:hypothetical protein